MAAPEPCVACGSEPGVVVVRIHDGATAPICGSCWTSGWKARAVRRTPRGSARRGLDRRRRLFEEQLLMVELLRRQVDDETELTPEWAEFISRLLMNIRFVVDVEPCGDRATDALQERVLGEVASVLRRVEERTTPSMASGGQHDHQRPDPA